jgi:hypothetical protein
MSDMAAYAALGVVLAFAWGWRARGLFDAMTLRAAQARWRKAHERRKHA